MAGLTESLSLCIAVECGICATFNSNDLPLIAQHLCLILVLTLTLHNPAEMMCTANMPVYMYIDLNTSVSITKAILLHYLVDTGLSSSLGPNHIPSHFGDTISASDK